MKTPRTARWIAVALTLPLFLGGCGGPTLSPKQLEAAGIDYVVRVRFENDGGANLSHCPKSTRARNRSNNGDAEHCRDQSGLKQADAWCVARGDTVSFRPRSGSKVRRFEIVPKAGRPFPFGNTCKVTPVKGQHRVQCTVTNAKQGDTLYYNIRNDTCELDPRIIVNRATTWN